MKSKILFAALAALMVLTLLCGCQLAKPDEGTDVGRDTLCGVFITLDYLNLSETEITMNWRGEPEVSYSETRIYAARTEDKNGCADYTFDGIEGFRFFAAQVDTPGQEPYMTSIIDDSIQDASLSLVNSDICLSGTIYFDVHAHCQIYANPVYQTPGGEVYVTGGNGLCFETINEGDTGSTTLSATVTETTDGETTTQTTEVEIKVMGLNTNQEIVLKQMDEDDQVVDETIITQDSIPEVVRVLPDTAYMILEEHCIDREGNAVVKRTLLDTSEEYFNVRFTGEHGIVVPSMVTLKHSGQQ